MSYAGPALPRRPHPCRLGVVGVSLACVLALPPARAATLPDDNGSVPSTWSAEFGSEYSQGRYGSSQRTHTVDTHLELRWRDGPWRATLGTAYLAERTGPSDRGRRGRGSNSGSGGGGGGGGDTAEDDSFRSAALDDLSVSLSRALVDPAEVWVPRLGLSVVLPTGHTASGVTRAEPQLNASLRWAPHGPWGSRVSLGHRWRTREDPEIRNTWHARVGLEYAWSEALSLALEHAQATTRYPGDPPPRETSLGFDHSLSRRFDYGLYALAGRSEGSPDWGLALSLRWQM